MKKIYFGGIFIFLLFIGCSSTYTITDFGTKEKFYEEFNDTFKEREMKVTLINDSSFSIYNGAFVQNDTLFSLVNFEGKQSRSLALAEIVDIKYAGTDITKTLILLKNGDDLKAENVNIVHDSINFVEIKSLIMINNIPIDKVKTASYTDRWKGIFTGMKIGFASGSIIGYLQGKTATDYHGETQELSGFLGGAIVGIITCGVAGYFIGYPIIYEFNK